MPRQRKLEAASAGLRVRAANPREWTGGFWDHGSGELATGGSVVAVRSVLTVGWRRTPGHGHLSPPPVDPNTHLDSLPRSGRGVATRLCHTPPGTVFPAYAQPTSGGCVQGSSRLCPAELPSARRPHSHRPGLPQTSCHHTFSSQTRKLCLLLSGKQPRCHHTHCSVAAPPHAARKWVPVARANHTGSSGRPLCPSSQGPYPGGAFKCLSRPVGQRAVHRSTPRNSSGPPGGDWQVEGVVWRLRRVWTLI